MKKFLIFTLCVIFAVMMVACGNDATTEETATPDVTDEEITTAEEPVVTEPEVTTVVEDVTTGPETTTAAE